MAGLLDDLTGDTTTQDQFGQTQADRRQPLWSGLIQAGLLGVAAGGNLMPSERAKYIAQAGGALGDIGPQMLAQRSAAAQNLLRSQQLQAGQQQLQQQQIQAYAQSPEFQQWVKSLPPEMQAPIMGQALKGDFSGVEKARESMKPKIQTDATGRTTVTYPDGSAAQIDPGATTGRWLVPPKGPHPDVPPGLRSGGSGNFDPSQPNVGGTDGFYLAPLQNQPHDIAVQALQVARGEIQPPNVKSNPNAAQINSLAAQLGPNRTSYQTRQKFDQSIGGERGIVSTVSRATQHEGTAIDLYNAIGNQDGGAGQKYWNTARNQWNSINNPDLVQKLTAARVAMVNAITEAKNAIAGAKGTGVVEREDIEKSIDPNMSIAQMKGLMQGVHSQMMEALTSVAYRGSQVRHTEVTPESLVGPDVWKQHQNVEKFYTAPPTPQQKKPGQIPIPGKTKPDGSPLYQHSDGQIYEVPEQ